MKFFGLFLVFIIVMVVIYTMNSNISKKKDKPYYEINEIEPKLKNIDKIKHKILKEVMKIKEEKEWYDWPEKELYDQNKSWKVYPLNVFGNWMNKNCDMCPNLTMFLKSLPTLKMAILSKMSPGTILTPHTGWAKHANTSIRCQYGIIVPEKCAINVFDKEIWIKKYQRQFKWVIFDDSKMHNAENLSNDDRIMLILDVKRPNDIEVGKSTEDETKELLEIIKYANEHSK